MIEVKRIYTGQMSDYLDRELGLSLRGVELLPDDEVLVASCEGTWHGAGARLLGLTGQVMDRQVENLYVDGLHPDADRMVHGYLSTCPRLTIHAYKAAYRAAQLGQRSGVFRGDRPLRTALYRAYRAHNLALDVHPGAPIDRPIRDGIRVEVATRLFSEKHGRPPQDADELARSIRTMSHPAQGAVGAFEVTFLSGPLTSVPPTVVAEMLDSLEIAAGFTRVGASPHQVVVATQGLVMAVFAAAPAMDGANDGNTRVLVSSKVATDDGRWLALDARHLYRALPELRLKYAALFAASLAKTATGSRT